MGRKKVTYAWRSGYRGGRVTAATAAAELDRLKREHRGGFGAQTIVDASRPDSAPLHPEFEWNDEIAGEEFRKEQARRLVRAVVIQRPDEPAHREWVHVPGPKPTYERQTQVAKSPDQTALALVALRQSVTEAEEALQEFQNVCEMAGVDEVTLQKVIIAAEAAARFRDAIDAIH